MAVDKKRQIVIWLAWAIIFSCGLWYAFQITPDVTIRWIDAASFIILLVVACLVPIVVNNTPLSATQWITLSAFLKFGLFFELILGQITVIAVLLRLRIPKEQSYRLALNSSMFVLVSVLSGQIYYWLGGNHDSFYIYDYKFTLLAGTYLLSYFIINQSSIKLLQLLLMRKIGPIFSEDLLWEALLTIVIFPIGLVLYFLYNSIGAASILLVGIPVVSMLLLLRVYNHSQLMNEYMQQAVELGHRLTERLKTEEVIDVFVRNLLNIFPTDYLYIFNAEDERLRLIRSFEQGKYVEIDEPPIKKLEGIAGLAWASKKALRYKEKKEWKNTVKGYIPADAESILVVPMIKNNEATGIVFLASSQKRVYQEYHLLIVDILSSYLAIALENAKHYEKTKFQSERCPLTNLYNARVFNERLEAVAKRFNKGELTTLSLLLIDIDHFKRVNDTYGHESGNEILVQFADLLRTIVAEKGFLARYGGEEFVILLPDVDKDDASRFGELIRETIESRAFVLFDDLAEVRRMLTVRITVSIGVASAPCDTEDCNELVRCADRALYIGAKRDGRNKVAQYAG